jgi:hypothetical protein
MLVIVICLLAILLFVITFLLLKVIPKVQAAIDEAYTGVSVLFNNTLSDDEKESAIQSAGLELFKLGVEILWRISACLAAATIPIYLIDKASYVPANSVITFMLRWDFILITTVIFICIGMLVSRYNMKSYPRSDYSSIDQITHKLAFSGPAIQLTAADIEDHLFASQVRKIEDKPAIFITSLPRAGTTILLTSLYQIPSMASHLYRDMPFVMAPLLWSRVSSMFGKGADLIERAHGDGISICHDSPEAFEEVIWRTFWPNKYHQMTIDLWNSEDSLPEAKEFFMQHFRKIVALRTNGTGRYISKNNNNIARLELLPLMFPGSQTIVPLREPAEHAASLLRQHKNFLQQQAADPFIERYMRDIGHFDFGTLHTPIAFPSFDISANLPENADYWLDYWIAAYEVVLERVNYLHIIAHEKLEKEPEKVLHKLCERIDIDPAGVNLAKYCHPIKKKADKRIFKKRKLAKATEIFNNLVKHQI